MSRRYGLGVDTGGTFTDAVIVDLSDYTVISKAKSPTTHSDLSVGLFSSVRKVFSNSSVRPSDITLAGVSTTLATNSVLEGKGGEVGLIFIGWDPKRQVSFGERNQVFVRGGYDSKGRKQADLDLDEVRDAIAKVSEGVDAIAISGLFAVINPEQERRVKDMAIEMTGLPTVMGTELSSSLGVDERARTAVLNGRLVPVVSRFFDDISSTFREMGITAPVMVYKGDGSVMSIERARRYPVESVFSGPAASSVGGRIISGREDFIMVDIGGTSTDIALVEHGMPEIRNEGASICGWRTHVKAVDMYTVALGGDSLIKLSDTKIDLGNGVVIPFFSLSRYKSFNFTIGPERVVPLSVFAASDPSVIAKIRRTNVCEYHKLISMPDPSEVSERCMRVARAMEGGGPMSLLEIMDNTDGLWDIGSEVARLRDKGHVMSSGLTPSDLMVFRGEFENGDPEGPRAGVEALAEMLRMSPDDVVRRLLDMVHTKIAEAITVRLLDDKLGDWHCDRSMRFVREMVSVKPPKGFAIMPRIDVPIVGIGAPTRFLMGDVGERLGTELIFPENGDVGNAVGAVCSRMVASMTATITPADDGTFRVSVPFTEQTYLKHLEQAVQAARSRLTRILTESLAADGAQNIRMMFKSKTFATSDDGTWTQDGFDHAVIIGTATGDPPELS